MDICWKVLATKIYVAAILLLGQSLAAYSHDWPTLDMKESDCRKYYDERKGRLDPLEGIYSFKATTTILNKSETTSSYRLAIFSSRDFTGLVDSTYDFFAIILESDVDAWLPGEVKALFRKTAFHSLYEAKWYGADYKPMRVDYKILENGIVYSRLEEIVRMGYGDVQAVTEDYLIRSYPHFAVASSPDSRVGKTDGETPVSTGSGFVLTKGGMVITNHHVVAEGKRIEVFFPKNGASKAARVKIKDVRNDIVVLELQDFSILDLGARDVPFVFADESKVRIGQDAFTLGFPLGDIMGATVRLATGTINSLYGLRDDPRLYQINNPIQPGNSGGALFNYSGELVGICVSGLSAKYFYDNLGIVPQNMNFAIKASYLRNLIGMLPDSDSVSLRKDAVSKGPLDRVVEQVSPFIVQVRVY